jgi:hypothetical protein
MTGGLFQYGSEVMSAGKNNGLNSAVGIASIGAAAGVGAFVTGFSQDPVRGSYNIGLGVLGGKALGMGVPIPKGSSVKSFLTSSPGEMITGSIRSNKALGKLGISENGASRAGSIDIYTADMESALRPKGENTIGISPVKGIKSKDILQPGDISITPVNNPLRGDTFYYPTTKNYLAGREGAIPKGSLDYYFEKVSIEPNGKTATLTENGAFWTKNYKVKSEIDPKTAPKISEEEFMSIEEPTGGYPNVGVEARDLGITIERRKGSKYSQLEFEDKLNNWNKFYSGLSMDDLLLNRVAPKVKTMIDANPEISSFARRGRPFGLALGMTSVSSTRQLQQNDVFQGQSMIMENKPKSTQKMLNLQISGLKSNQRLDTEQNNDNKLSWSYIMGQRQSQSTKTTQKTGSRTMSLNTTTMMPAPTRKSLKVPAFGGNLGSTGKNPFSFGSTSKRWKNFGIMSDYISTPKRTTKKRRHH